MLGKQPEYSVVVACQRNGEWLTEWRNEWISVVKKKENLEAGLEYDFYISFSF